MTGGLTKSKPDLLPTTYVDAKNSLAKCQRVDECKGWADKAMALASYAKQMKDESLENMAKRIRARAVERGGKLLLKVAAEKGGRPIKETGVGTHISLRKAAAKEAGLSSNQAAQMIRVARVPADQFEAAVEDERPATVERLAQMGTKKSERVKPAPYRAEWLDWTQAIAHLAELPACGLGVLVDRRPEEIGRLKDECAKALRHLNSWKSALESANVKSKIPDHAA